MAKRKDRTRRLDRSAVLAGRIVPGVDELLILIHDSNPTGEDLPAEETTRRYAEKSKLQSILLRNSRDRLRVEEQPDGEIVAIADRYGAGDACHARLNELDPDVRSWVQRQLDIGASDEPDRAAPMSRGGSRGASRSRAEPTSEPIAEEIEHLGAGELREAGWAALEEWDYDRARACFGAAVWTMPWSGSFGGSRGIASARPAGSLPRRP